jgi:ketosteroid isomerase-like protein
MSHQFTARRAAPVLFCIAAFACAPSDQPMPAATHSAEEDRAAVEAAVRRHWTAINGGDTATVGAQHTADLTLIMTEAPNRFAVPSPTADSLWPLLLASKPQYVVEDLQVQLVGDVGIASLYLSGGVVDPAGRHDTRRRRVTEVWVRQADGAWKEMHHHDSVYSSL